MIEEFPQRVYTTSRPWDESEFVRVDGMPLVYTETVREGFRVRLPGCKWATVKQLEAVGHKVTMPRIRRVE